MDFTVIVPTYNRPAALAGCLDALRALDYPPDRYEAVVVDDGGHHDLGPIVDAGAAQVRVTLVRQPNRGPGAARNAGAAHASGKWLAFTDDDCRPRKGWLDALGRTLAINPQALVGGRTINALPANVYAEASQRVLEAAYAHFNRDTARARFLASNNMAVARAAFLDAGGFDTSFRVASEDRELCDRWLWRGRRMVWVQDAVVEHRHALTLRSFVRQHYAYGRGAARFHLARAQRGSGHLWDDLSFRWRWRDLLIKPVMASPRRATTLALLGFWQAANTAGFLRESVAAMRARS